MSDYASALPSLCRSPSPRSSGRACVPRDEFLDKAYIVNGCGQEPAQPEEYQIQLARGRRDRAGGRLWPAATAGLGRVPYWLLTGTAVSLMPGANISKMISGWKHLRRKGLDPAVLY